MPARSTDRCFHPAQLLLGNLNRIKTLGTDISRMTAEFAQGIPDPSEYFRIAVHEKLGPHSSAGFLITQDHQQNIAGWLKPLNGGIQQSAQHHGYAPFHIQRAPPPNIAIDQFAFKGRVGPLLVGRCNDIDVTIEHQGRGRIPPFNPGH